MHCSIQLIWLHDSRNTILQDCISNVHDLSVSTCLILICSMSNGSCSLISVQLKITNRAENMYLILSTPTYSISHMKHFATNLQISSRSFDTTIDRESWNPRGAIYEDSSPERRNYRSVIWITTYCYCLCDIMSGDTSTQGKNSHPSCIIKDIPQVKLKYKISAVLLKCRILRINYPSSRDYDYIILYGIVRILTGGVTSLG